MPNHVTQRLTITFPTPDAAKAFIREHVNEGNCLDFQSLIPKPEEYEGSSGLSGYGESVALLAAIMGGEGNSNALARALALNEFEIAELPAELIQSYALKRAFEDPTLLKVGLQHRYLLLKYGSGDWYDWCVDNWGTKWDAYSSDQNLSDDGLTLTLQFDTAWGAPHPILHHLTAVYPALTFDYVAFDEGWGFAYYGTDLLDLTLITPERNDPKTLELFETLYGQPPEWDDE
jgi:hypothetical protein